MKRKVFAVALAVSAIAAQAQVAEPSKFGFVGALGINSGGDTLVKGQYTNGEPFSIKAGNGVLLSFGMTYALNPSVDLQGTVGIESDSTNASNGSIKFDRMPIEALAFYNFSDKYRLGGGFRSATGAKLSSSGVASGLNADLNAGVGVVLEGQYMLGSKNSASRFHPALYLRYVSEKYTSPQTNESINGNHLGLGVAVYF
ncbi:MAG: hypothetical protein RLY90_1122 [Pseudomonadota bacterium]